MYIGRDLSISLTLVIKWWFKMKSKGKHYHRHRKDSMGAGIKASATFYLFPSLPYELRLEVWRAALPIEMRPAMFLYREGLWHTRLLSAFEEDYLPDENLNWILEFKHALIDPVQYQVSLFFVNREAHAVALAWIRNGGLGVRTLNEQYPPLCIRSFNPENDILYITAEKWNSFLGEADQRLLEINNQNLQFQIVESIRHIAISEEMLNLNNNDSAIMDDLFGIFGNVREVYIILNPQPSFGTGRRYLDSGLDICIRPRWEIKDIQGQEYVWNSSSSRFEPSEGSNSEIEWKSVEEGLKLLHGTFFIREYIEQQSIPCFKVKPVSTIIR